jgi:6-phosphogluconate dehydrogenase
VTSVVCDAVEQSGTPVIGLVGLAVMGQNLALNIASKGFTIAVHNRSPEKVRGSLARCASAVRASL